MLGLQLLQEVFAVHAEARGEVLKVLQVCVCVVWICAHVCGAANVLLPQLLCWSQQCCQLCQQFTCSTLWTVCPGLNRVLPTLTCSKLLFSTPKQNQGKLASNDLSAALPIVLLLESISQHQPALLSNYLPQLKECMGSFAGRWGRGNAARLHVL